MDWYRFQPHREVRERLVDDGWRTPNTYGNEFADIADFSAVYLFLLVDEDFSRSLVAYVGMSKSLEKRMIGHSIMADLKNQDGWPMTWFKRVNVPALRRVEASYIKKFDPPWNLAGRKRGVRGL